MSERTAREIEIVVVLAVLALLGVLLYSMTNPDAEERIHTNHVQSAKRVVIRSRRKR